MREKLEYIIKRERVRSNAINVVSSVKSHKSESSVLERESAATTSLFLSIAPWEYAIRIAAPRAYAIRNAAQIHPVVLVLRTPMQYSGEVKIIYYSVGLCCYSKAKPHKPETTPLTFNNVGKMTVL